ncbi:hypothetical protein Acr_28g0012930 [Actinidia rufa]|uniref:Uncharacterized protein n=1 Tax=Actinidia rufa TaxID=165716 RepID=A0A7J0HC16_9ERIC|nr:hypothetical protein Acr_28g0012930 [Actinidia rufa]
MAELIRASILDHGSLHLRLPLTELKKYSMVMGLGLVTNGLGFSYGLASNLGLGLEMGWIPTISPSSPLEGNPLSSSCPSQQLLIQLSCKICKTVPCSPPPGCAAKYVALQVVVTPSLIPCVHNWRDHHHVSRAKETRFGDVTPVVVHRLCLSPLSFFMDILQWLHLLVFGQTSARISKHLLELLFHCGSFKYIHQLLLFPLETLSVPPLASKLHRFDSCISMKHALPWSLLWISRLPCGTRLSFANNPVVNHPYKSLVCYMCREHFSVSAQVLVLEPCLYPGLMANTREGSVNKEATVKPITRGEFRQFQQETQQILRDLQQAIAALLPREPCRGVAELHQERQERDHRGHDRGPIHPNRPLAYEDESSEDEAYAHEVFGGRRDQGVVDRGIVV